MSEYHPPQSKIVARLHTLAGWISGTFHMPMLHGFVDFLNQDHSFVKLTDARLPGGDDIMPFTAVRKSSILTVMPNAAEEDLQLAVPEAATETHQVSCLLDTGLVLGYLEMPEHTRVSDFLLRGPGFFPLRKCVVYDDRTKRHKSSPLAMVNADHVVAVSEREFK